MTEQTNYLLHLFSKLLQNPNVIVALHADGIARQMQNRGGRNGARGLLTQLWKEDGLTNSEIAELLDIRPSSVTAQVKQLEEDDMVTRVTDENDKRVSRVFLTDKGRSAKENRSEFHNDLSESIFEGLTDEERQQLAVLMEKLVSSQKAENFDFGKMFENWGPLEFDWHGMNRNMPKEMKEALRGAWKNQAGDFHESMRQFHDAARDAHNPWNFGHGGRERRSNFDPRRGREERNKKDNWDDF